MSEWSSEAFMYESTHSYQLHLIKRPMINSFSFTLIEFRSLKVASEMWDASKQLFLQEDGVASVRPQKPRTSRAWHKRLSTASVFLIAGSCSLAGDIYAVLTHFKQGQTPRFIMIHLDSSESF